MVLVFNISDKKTYTLHEFLIMRTNQLIEILENINVSNLSFEQDDKRTDYIAYVEAYQREATVRLGNENGLMELHDKLKNQLTVVINYYLKDIGYPIFDNQKLTEIFYSNDTDVNA